MWPYYFYPSGIKDKLRALEDYRNFIKGEIKLVERELEQVKHRIEELNRLMGKFPSINHEDAYLKATGPPARGMGYGWGGGRGRRGGWGWRGGEEPQLFQRPMNLPKKFKIAVASQAKGGLNDFISPTFARCPFFTLITIDSQRISDVKVVPNSYAGGASGVGIAVAQMLGNLGVHVVLAGNFGPNAYNALSQLGIQAIRVLPGMSIKEAIKQVFNVTA
ncbi:hypothetical protein DRN86_04810 [Candidatus Geothermarchaeota archaeon]|nr:MAG: hypothetical protein DRN86_04810 [Candidatus Geothermarchaeota archaeon]